MIDWAYYLALLCVLLAGLLLNVFTLPGNWLMLIAVFGYAWVTGWAYVGWVSLVVLFGLALLAEVVEFVAAGAGVKSAGGTILGTIGALVGGLLGAIFLTGLVPIPILGTVAGIILGTFLGAMAGELLAGKDVGKSALIGTGAAKGRLYGTLLKLAFGIVILLVSLAVAIPWGGRPVLVPVTQ